MKLNNFFVIYLLMLQKSIRSYCKGILQRTYYKCNMHYWRFFETKQVLFHSLSSPLQKTVIRKVIEWFDETQQTDIIYFFPQQAQSILYAKAFFVFQIHNIVLIVGMMAGAYVWGSVADSLGRRKVLIVISFMNAVCIVASSFSQNYAIFMVFRFLNGAAYVSQVTFKLHLVKYFLNVPANVSQETFKFHLVQRFLNGAAYVSQETFKLHLVKCFLNVPTYVSQETFTLHLLQFFVNGVAYVS